MQLMQSEELLILEIFEYVPSVQFLQTAEAFISEYFPGGQTKQVSFSNLALDPIEVEKVPGLHCRHMVLSAAAAAEEYFPAGHWRQDDDEFFSEYFPALHFVQNVAPTVYTPALSALA